MDNLTAKDVEVLKSELVQLEKRRDELDSKIKALTDERNEIDNECNTRKRKIESYKLTRSITDVNDNNSMTKFLYANT